MTELKGFQKPLRSAKRREISLARIHYSGTEAQCSCGWAYIHRRNKVREDAIDRHIQKHHAGRGIRL